jgi:hypothetical protein
MTSMAERSTSRHGALRRAIALVSVGAPLAVAGCSSTVGFDDPSADYLQRTALVSTPGGDAPAVNVAVQTPTPWPRYANDTNIPGMARVSLRRSRATKAARRARARARAPRRQLRTPGRTPAPEGRMAPPPEWRLLRRHRLQAIRWLNARQRKRCPCGATTRDPRSSRRQSEFICPVRIIREAWSSNSPSRYMP